MRGASVNDSLCKSPRFRRNRRHDISSSNLTKETKHVALLLRSWVVRLIESGEAEAEPVVMEVKPIPKPRSVVPHRPIPAPRRLPPTLPASCHSSQSSDSSQSEKSDEKSIPETRTANNEFFRNLSTSSRQLKDEISEKVTTKGRAVISSTRNASIRLEKSVKNLLTRRLTTLNQDELLRDNAEGLKMFNGPIVDDRCVSMPANDIFSSITFYSPLNTNLRSMKNEEDLSGMRSSPPPPVYPPPPHPDESIYDELQSVTSGSSRYETISSISSDKIDRDFPESFSLLNFALNQASDSDQSLNLSDVSGSLPREKIDVRRLSRSDSWTFYDTAAGTRSEGIDELDRISSAEEDTLDKDVPLLDRTSSASNESHASIQNSLYENLASRRAALEEKQDTSNAENRQQNSRSLLFEFDPFAKTSDTENVYSNFENNDMMLLETLLATSDSPSSSGSILDFQEAVDNEEDQNDMDDEDVLHPQISVVPPVPPKRFDSLPKSEHDEVFEVISLPDKGAIGKNPALLPKLAHLGSKKQPAVPPRKPPRNRPTDTPPAATDTVATTDDNVTVPATKMTVSPKSPEEGSTSPAGGKNTEEHRRVGMIQKLKKLRQDSSSHGIGPNMMNFVKSGSKLLSRNRDQARESSTKSMKLEKPKLNAPQNPATHRGIVYKTGVGIERAKDLVQRVAVLADQKLSFYTDKAMSTLKEVIHLDTVYSIHLLQDVKEIDGETVHCIAISVEGRPSVYVFYAKGIAERRIWAQRILEAFTLVFPTKYTSDLTRVGWVYLKEGVTGVWFTAWVLLHQRTLIYTKSLDPFMAVTFGELDLRKARCIVLREQEGPNPNAGSVPVVVVDAGGSGALHIAAPGTHEGSAWRHALYQAAITCGPALEQQQLTQEDVPVILDKCINFIYAHGIMTEGIYRRSGSTSAVVRLLTAFRHDAWQTQITRGSYTEHDVATVLRRFLRDLPDPLFPANIHDRLCLNTENVNENEQITVYRTLLSTLSPVPAATLRRILAHLHCLSQQSSRNLMTVENLSAIWGPTLMHAGENSAEEWNRSETRVIGDLIKLYPKLYQLTAAELAKEAKILEVLEKHHVSNNGPRGAPSGDLKIWIYIFSKDRECVNVTIGPQKTAFDICVELAEKTNSPAHELCLEEYTLSGALERPLHHTERVLETVARWGYWEPEDRKDNILILKRDHLYKDILPLIKPPLTPSGELKFASSKMKHFKTYLFEFSQGKLCCYKDKVCSTKLYEWRIEDIIWYLGHEPKRNPQTGWSITFITKNNKPMRCKETPFFGCTIAGTLKDEQYKWLAAMIFGEYQLNLRPSAVNLMDP
ncbi:rhoGAP_ARAP and RA_ARAPs domain-containing protein RhoGAP15B isoform X3 [Lasioglossum baleicum]|uniref:rhoGAP_ARAP and RA_ARAPs domain-containing protein RhoGAP15B isoform X3 n=1 Tax=Lasioglossum baleicum TaxID=434251 RepID=UPI003FCEB003